VAIAPTGRVGASGSLAVPRFNGDGSSELFGWNGVAGFYAKYPIEVPAGALVRVYLTHLLMGRPMASFTLPAEAFRV